MWVQMTDWFGSLRGICPSKFVLRQAKDGYVTRPGITDTPTYATLFLLILFLPRLALADAGVLLPMNHTQPDPSLLSLEEMWVNIQVDNGDARVWVRQIFSNHTARVEEGTYIFALPSRATVSDFAVWDGVVRIPGVILERRRAEEVYNNLKWQHIDPGLLQMGERTADEARRTAVFSARIVPIPAYGGIYQSFKAVRWTGK